MRTRNKPGLLWKEWSAAADVAERARQTMDAVQLKGLSLPDEICFRSAIVFGTGAVGGVALNVLARCGVGSLCAVDPDTYGAESFLTQPSDWDQEGQLKAWVQAEAAQRANPAVRIRAAVGFAQELPLAVLRRADVYLVAGDNLELLLWAARMAMALGKPLVQGAVYGETASAIVRSYDLADAQAACPQCGMGADELQQLRSIRGCDPQTMRLTGIQPTRTLPVVCGMAGQLAACEALKWLAGANPLALCGEEYSHSLLTHRGWRTELPRSERCGLSHRGWRLADMTSPHTEVTPEMLASELGVGGEPGLLQVRSELPWISYVLCSGCERTVAVQRFARLGAPVGRCPCGAELEAAPQGSYSVIPADDLRDCWSQPLERLGLTNGEAVGMLADDDWVYFFPPVSESVPDADPSALAAASERGTG